ncbi:hypothetical protein PMAYCL1PPCAC_30173 [Pristionchus mayeri]|uniref:CNNM transmembrane domain-containing protein n=1 Tax=Pristionchus mayeri TaxID=1317129 RepID=A0AAN5DBC3_9BILA|nr:hypothetical protein PMAYCL1PPCAC_30173 [Pristionchus mayeri]
MALLLRLLFTYIGVVSVQSAQHEPNYTSSLVSSSQSTVHLSSTTHTPIHQPCDRSSQLFGLRLSGAQYERGNIVIPPDKLRVTIYGVNLQNIKILIAPGTCENQTNLSLNYPRVDFPPIIHNTPNMIEIEHDFRVGKFEICARIGESYEIARFEQVADREIVVRMVESTSKPYTLHYLWLQILVLVLLHVLSAMFSGLTLGLMTLTVRELEIIATSGSEEEQSYARAILPLRRKGNQLLCTLLLGNTLCNATISILFENLWPEPGISIPTATVTMLLLGEILPQSICVNNALATGARLLFFAQFWIYLFSLIAWPISKVLDRIVGEEHESYDRKRLMELMKRVIENNPDVAEDELKIAAGAMNLKGKVVQDSMTAIEEVFMLPETATLNSNAIAAIMRAGYTRIPVFKEGNKKDICDVLIVKDLALIDPDDCYTVRMLCNIYKRPIPRMASNTTLFTALQTFKGGDDGHMALVHDAKNGIIGIITLEDVVEEILQEEIKDEFDLKREKRGHEKILWDTNAPSVTMGKQLMTVTYQFCVNNEEFFADRFIEKSVLERLMAQCTRNVDMHYLKPLGGALTVPIKHLPRCAKLYTKNEMSDRYILILEGRAEVTIGQSGMKFEAGPFHQFGQELLQKLMQHADELCKRNAESPFDPKQIMQFKPDFSVAVFEECKFLEVTSDMYIKALRFTKAQRETKNTAAIYADFKSRGTPVSVDPSPEVSPSMGSKEKTTSKEHVNTAISLSSPNETESGRTADLPK